MKFSEEFLKEICNYLGSDLGAPPCQMLKEYMETSPNCKIFVEQIKHTIELIQAAEECEPVPEDLNQKLLKCLKLVSPEKLG